MAVGRKAPIAAVLIVAGLVIAPFAYAEPSDSGSDSTGSAGSARSGTNNSQASSKSASEAKAWQDLEDKTTKAADELTAAEAKTAADRITQAQETAKQRRDEARNQLDTDYQAADDAITQETNDIVTGIQDRFGTLQQLSSAQSALALEMSDAADEATVLAALESGDTATALAQIDQSVKDRKSIMADKRSLANTLADQTQGNLAVAQGIGQIMNSLSEMESLQQYDADKTREIMEAKAAPNPEAQADLMKQMVDLQKEVRDKLAAIQTAQTDAMKGIARSI